MKKETILKILAHSCFLLPGNIRQAKGWYLTLVTFLSFLTFLFVVSTTVIEFLGHTYFTNEKLSNEVYKSLKVKPVRPVAFCLKPGTAPHYMNETTTVDADTLGNNTNSETGEHHHKGEHDHGLLEDIVHTAYRLLTFAGNILVRLFIWFSFPSLIALLGNILEPKEEQSRFMTQLWLSSCAPWSPGEKIFLCIIFLSQLIREIELSVQFYSSISYTGMNLLDGPCLLFQIVLEQMKAIFSRELVMEVSTFSLIILMKTFANVLATISGQGKDDDGEMEIEESSGFEMEGKAPAPNNDKVFVRNKAMMLKAEMSKKTQGNLILPNGMTTIHGHISEIVGGANDLELVFLTSRKKERHLEGEVDPGKFENVETIYAQMNFVISMYFELMSIWERAGRVAGFITLLLFCELTTTFCFNTYITLDTAMEFGIGSLIGMCGIFRGIVIVTKFVCVCNAAQALRDMTPVLLDRILKLKLKLLSLPNEAYRKPHSKLDGSGGVGMAPYECERCRGLGSFLSEMVSYIRGHPFELSALGYFTVSRSTLTTITGVIVTYLVVLVQFQSYSSA